MRPRKATCGDDTRRISSTSEMIAPMSTPLSSPAQRTPSSATIAMRNSLRCTCQRWRSSLTFTKQFHTVHAKIDERGYGDAADHHEQSDGLLRQQFLAEDQQSQCRAAEHERACVSLTDVTEEHIHAFPKISVSAFHTKQLWQLRARELQRHASLETDEDSFRDEVHHRTCAR